jgi:predicted metallo-beta-lactamase superfamily hydrolase
MDVRILGADSCGVRSLATHATTKNLRILIDPGVSVSPRRYGMPPHPKELEALRTVRAAIQRYSKDADAIVITHFHHDHYSSFEDRELDLTDRVTARAVYGDTPVYTKAWQRKINHAQKQRAIEFVRALGRRVTVADGRSFGNLAFSPPVKHGEEGSKQGWVIMVSIDDCDNRLVFGSDVQMIENEAVDWILDRKPRILVVSGPPTYLGALSDASKHKAHTNLSRLTRAIPTIVVDHHLLRARDYEDFLAEPRSLAGTKGHRILTAAEFMGRPNRLLEAGRRDLWKKPAP